MFRALPRIPENIRFIIEAKRFGDGVEGALQQAKGYAAALRISSDLIVTDGLRYRLYEHDEDRNDFRPAAYANLARLQQSAQKLLERIRRGRGFAMG